MRTLRTDTFKKTDTLSFSELFPHHSLHHSLKQAERQRVVSCPRNAQADMSSIANANPRSLSLLTNIRIPWLGWHLLGAWGSEEDAGGWPGWGRLWDLLPGGAWDEGGANRGKRGEPHPPRTRLSKDLFLSEPKVRFLTILDGDSNWFITIFEKLGYDNHPIAIRLACMISFLYANSNS